MSDLVRQLGSVPESAASKKASVAGVLVVEDDPLIASYITNILDEIGFVVTGTATCGEEALGTLSADTELALVDISLAGGMDGVEVARRLRDRHGISVIFLSACSDPQTIARAGAVSSFGFLSKPVRPSQVYNALISALKRRRNARPPVEELAAL